MDEQAGPGVFFSNAGSGLPGGGNIKAPQTGDFGGGEAARAHYNIPGILHFLQHEWARFEVERAQWDVERAELQDQPGPTRTTQDQPGPPRTTQSPDPDTRFWSPGYRTARPAGKCPIMDVQTLRFHAVRDLVESRNADAALLTAKLFNSCCENMTFRCVSEIYYYERRRPRRAADAFLHKSSLNITHPTEFTRHPRTPWQQTKEHHRTQAV